MQVPYRQIQSDLVLSNHDTAQHTSNQYCDRRICDTMLVLLTTQ
jgi:hypothetical protein